ncbi:MAG: N-acetylmuramoyl-L-alanine amidase [bacterium]
MKENVILVGTITQDGYLKTESGKILLTKLPIQAAQGLESAGVELPPEGVGNKVIVKGDLSENVLYSATVLETVTPFTEALVNTLSNKGILSLEEMQGQIEKSGLKEAVTKEEKKMCALVIGHKKSSPGGMNAKSGITEFDFNEDLSIRIANKVKKGKIERIYRRTYKNLPGDINELKPDFVVSLHCNAFNQKTSGTEMLYYYKSNKGKLMAEILQRNLVNYLKLPDRGIKAKDSEDRGGYLLRYTNAPCVITEPFFIDNDNYLSRARQDIDGLAGTYSKAIDEIYAIV